MSKQLVRKTDVALAYDIVLALTSRYMHPHPQYIVTVYIYLKRHSPSRAHFGSTYTKIATIKRRLPWPLRKET